jgi:7-carboxy-7-deazaguanine synthase
MAMAKIKISELFYSLQGEGRFVGVPSVFLRTFGCNFTCSGFGMPPGQLSTEADVVGSTHKAIPFATFEGLPLVTTGCDSYASWHSDFKDLSPMLTVDAIVDRMLELTPNGRWEQDNGNDVHLVITGGEPLLGWQRAYADLLNHPGMSDLKNITFETNGTQQLSKDFRTYLERWVDLGSGEREVTFSVSAKLSASGEKWEEAICPEVVAGYQSVGRTYLKFVVETKEHIDEAIRAVAAFRQGGFRGVVHLMPQGGIVRPYNENKMFVADICVEQGFNYSPRLHVDLWGNGWGK